jgi:hypothetical protein
MANRFRKVLESIVYVGMTPGAARTPDSPRKLRFLAPLERVLSAPSPSDPLYLTNRTFGQRLTRLLLIVIPMVVVVAAVVVALGYFAPKTAKPAKEMTAAEIAARVLPDFDKDIQVEANKEVQVLDAHFEHAAALLVGSIQNKSARTIQEAVVVFDLADARRSLLGGITVTETNLAPGAVRQFKQPIVQNTAAYAVVRDVRTR